MTSGPASAQSDSRLYCAAESGINKIVIHRGTALGDLAKIGPGASPPEKTQLEKNNAEVSKAPGCAIQRIAEHF